MKKSKRIQTLVNLAQKKVDAVAKQLAAQQAKVLQDKEKLTQLEEYAEQYRSEKNLMGMNAYLTTNYQHFVDRLGQAIQQQKQVIARSEQQAAFVQQQWMKARSKEKSMDWLQKKYLTAEQVVEQKQEQAQSDEFAMRCFIESMRR